MKNLLHISWIILGVLWCQVITGQNTINYTYTGNSTNNRYATITGSSGFTNSEFKIEATTKQNWWDRYSYPIISITSIAASQNKRITTVSIGSNIGATVSGTTGTIAATAFDYCPNLKAFTINGSSEYYSANKDVLFNKTQSQLLFYPVAKTNASYEIPSTVTSIANSATLNNKITTLTFTGETVPSLSSSNFLSKINSSCILDVPYNLYEDFNKNSYWSQIPSLVAKQTVSGQVQIKYSKAGNLSKHLIDQQQTLTSLKITGPLNGTDIKFLRTLTSSYQLATLDLSDATIVSGGGSYYSSYTTQNNIFPKYAFYNCSILTNISLPKTVITIGEGAFKDTKLSQIEMSSCKFKTIEANAFANATALSSISLPNTVTSIAPSAFSETTGTAEFSINSTVYESIEGAIYANGKSVLFAYPMGSKSTSISIPKETNTINTQSGISNATALEEIFVSSENNAFNANDRILYSKDWKTLVLYPAAKKNTEFTLYNGVTTIAETAVLSKNLTSIRFEGNSVPTVTGNDFLSAVDKNACTLYVSKTMLSSFQNTAPWSSLVNIFPYDATIEELATKIKVSSAGTLENQIGDKKYTCTHLIIEGPLNAKDIKYLREMTGIDADLNPTSGKLQYLNLKDASIVAGGRTTYLSSGKGNTGNKEDITTPISNTQKDVFPDYAFFKCPILHTIILPASVSAIGNSALRGCSNLSSVDMTNCTFTSIAHNAFRSSTNITTFALPASITTIANDAFVETTKNKAFSFLAPSNYFEIQDGVLFTAGKDGLLAFPLGKETTNYTVPFGTKQILSCSFAYSKLETLNLPYGITNLEAWAFENTNFKAITIPATLTTIGECAFLGCKSVMDLYVQNPNPPTVIIKDQEINRAECTLHVPHQKKNDYQKANYWSEFAKIEELSDVIYVYTPGTLQSSILNMGFTPTDLTSLMIHGQLNSTDIKYLRELAGVNSYGEKNNNSKLKSVNLGQATIVSGGEPYLETGSKSYTTSTDNLGEYAFANTNLETFRFPSNIAEVNQNIFDKSTAMNCIAFDNLPNGMTANSVKQLLNEEQKNGIIIIGSNETSDTPNVIFANDQSATVELQDKYNYVLNEKLSLSKCTFTKEFSKATKDGECRGWETIILPFKPTEIRGITLKKENVYLVPFESDESAFAGKKVRYFWLRKLTTAGFVDIKFNEIEPYTPYIISMPNNPTDYNNTWNIAGNVQFIAEAANDNSIELHPTTEPAIFDGGAFNMTATFKKQIGMTDVYVVNKEGTALDLITTIKEKGNTIEAFEGYARVTNPAYAGIKRLPINDRLDVPSGIKDVMMNSMEKETHSFFIRNTSNGIHIVSNTDKNIRIYSIEGRLISTVYILEGDNYITLPKGIYLIEKQKAVVY